MRKRMEVSWSIRPLVILGLLLAARFGSLAAQIRIEGFDTAIVEARLLAASALDLMDMPGFAVAVTVGESIVWAEGFGHADLSGSTPITPETQFRLGSVSKVLTAATLARLTQEGVIDLHTPVQTYLPFLPRDQSLMTAHQLAGILDYVGAAPDQYDRARRQVHLHT